MLCSLVVFCLLPFKAGETLSICFIELYAIGDACLRRLNNIGLLRSALAYPGLVAVAVDTFVFSLTSGLNVL